MRGAAEVLTEHLDREAARMAIEGPLEPYNRRLGDSAMAVSDERLFVRTYLGDVRTQMAAALSSPPSPSLPDWFRPSLRQVLDRADALHALMAEGNWDLHPPLRVGGVEIR